MRSFTNPYSQLTALDHLCASLQASRRQKNLKKKICFEPPQVAMERPCDYVAGATAEDDSYPHVPRYVDHVPMWMMHTPSPQAV